MDIEKHRDEFLSIIEKYNLQDADKAEEIAVFLTKTSGGKVDSDEFAKSFAMDEYEAKIFLSFIHKGIQFKEKHMTK